MYSVQYKKNVADMVILPNFIGTITDFSIHTVDPFAIFSATIKSVVLHTLLNRSLVIVEVVDLVSTDAYI